MTAEVQERMEATRWRMGKGSLLSSTLLTTAGRKVTRKTIKIVSIVFVSCRSSLRRMRITVRLLGYETGVDIPTLNYKLWNDTIIKHNRLPTGAHSVEDGRVADDDREAGKCESKQEEKHFGRSANTKELYRHQNLLKLHLPLASRLIVQVKVSLSSPKVPHTDSNGGTWNCVETVWLFNFHKYDLPTSQRRKSKLQEVWHQSMASWSTSYRGRSERSTCNASQQSLPIEAHLFTAGEIRVYPPYWWGWQHNCRRRRKGRGGREEDQGSKLGGNIEQLSVASWSSRRGGLRRQGWSQRRRWPASAASYPSPSWSQSPGFQKFPGRRASMPKSPWRGLQIHSVQVHQRPSQRPGKRLPCLTPELFHLWISCKGAY